MGIAVVDRVLARGDFLDAAFGSVMEENDCCCRELLDGDLSLEESGTCGV
jgi:hypothetical protein